MSDNTESSLISEKTPEKDAPSDVSSLLVGHSNTPTSIRLFGQFKANGFGFSNLSSASTFGHRTSSETNTGDQPTSATYFTSTLAKISGTSISEFGSSSTPLAVSLASLGANKSLFGGSSITTPSSFTDLKMTSTKSLERDTSKSDDDHDDREEEGDEEEEDSNKASLLATATEYEAKRASTHPTTTHIQGDTLTGEENEITKFQIAGKLFMYNSEQQQFVERGYGILKINESHEPSNWDKLQARLIMRLDKSFRVILNSPIFSKMTVERVTDRSVRFGAQDECQLRVFIIKTSTHDCNNLCQELQSRIQIIDRQQVTSSKATTPTKHNVVTPDDTSPQVNCSSVGTRKRSHSRSDSDTSETTNDLPKKSKLVEVSRDVNKPMNPSATIAIRKLVEQEPTNRSAPDDEDEKHS